MYNQKLMKIDRFTKEGENNVHISKYHYIIVSTLQMKMYRYMHGIDYSTCMNVILMQP